MWRRFHSVAGLAAMALVIVLALSGAALSVWPMLNRINDPVQATAGLTVAELAGAVTAQVPEADKLHRTPTGAITLDYTDADMLPQTAYVDAASGAILGPVTPPGPVYAFLKTLHRSLFLGDAGRIVAGVGAAAMVLLALSGAGLLVSRAGGWRRVLDRPKGSRSARLHVYLARLALVGLIVSSLTGLWIVGVEFEWITVTPPQTELYPTSTAGTVANPADLAGLQAIPLSDLRDLTFPFAGDATDVFTAHTNAGLTLVDQVSGAVLETVPNTASQTAYEWIYALHTGQGLPLIGLILGLGALAVALIGPTGLVIWWRGQPKGGRKIAHNRPAQTADIVILVGSEGGTTWGFAQTLHAALTTAGHKVHTAPANSFRPDYKQARHVFFLAATYGNGNAPASASKLLARIGDMTTPPTWSWAVLGFGDRAFAHYCQFAKDLEEALTRVAPRTVLPLALINRQSPQAFASWGADLGAALGIPLTLDHRIELPQTREYELIDKRLYGVEIQEPTAVLRFRAVATPNRSLWSRIVRSDRPVVGPSDLLGILPPESAVPRYYSVASAPSSDEVEICVKRQIGGICSGMLHDLAVGDRVQGFVKPNPDFAPAPGRKPIILVGAGTGIAPLMGMIRANTAQRNMHLFWGGRVPTSDFLYEDDLKTCQADRRLTSLTTAFSRSGPRAYVQDRLREQAGDLAQMLRRGASIMVCGGDAMAQAVMAEFDAMLVPMGLSIATLKARGQYAEDVF